MSTVVALVAGVLWGQEGRAVGIPDMAKGETEKEGENKCTRLYQRARHALLPLAMVSLTAVLL